MTRDHFSRGCSKKDNWNQERRYPMSIISNSYSSGKITLLRQLLENNAQAGTPSDYEIRVDGMKVIPRTNNPELFDNHEDFVNQDTSEIMIIIYDGGSRRSTRHILSMKEKEKKEAALLLPVTPALSGVEIERMMEDKLKAQREAWEHNLLKKENKELKDALEEAESDSDKLVEVLEKAKANGNRIGGIHWGDIAGVAMEGIIKRNVHLLAKIPGAEALAGIIAEDNKALPEPEKEEPETKASFRRKPDPAEKEVDEEEENNPSKEIDEEDRDRQGVLKEFRKCFKTEQRIGLALQVLNQLVDKPDALEPALIFIHGWNSPKKKETPSPETKKPEREEAPIAEAPLKTEEQKTPATDEEEEEDSDESVPVRSDM
jgi:hypothetical protein